MEKEKAIEIFNKRMDCKDAYQADPSCDGNCFSCEYYTSAEEEKEAMQTAISALEKQEQAENEWCPDCAEYDKERHCCHRFTKVIRQTVEECKREWANEGWIPVTERLPEEDDYRPCYGYDDGAVWWLNDVGMMGLGWYYTSTENWAFYDEITHVEGIVGNVIAWRPLPEAYTEEEFEEDRNER